MLLKMMPLENSLTFFWMNRENVTVSYYDQLTKDEQIEK